MTRWFDVVQGIVKAESAIKDASHTAHSYVNYIRANGGDHLSDMRKALRLQRKLNRLYYMIGKLYEEATK